MAQQVIQLLTEEQWENYQAITGDPPPHQFFSLIARDLSGSVTAMFGGGPAQMTGGIGGWVTEERPGLHPAVWWKGATLYEQTVPFIFEKRAIDGSVEPEVAALRALGGREGAYDPPPVLAIRGRGLHRPDLDWIMSEIEWGDAERRERDGRRVYQEGTVTLLQYSPVVGVVESAAKRARKPRGRTYIVRHGDTLAKIAAKQHVKGGWKVLAKLNHIRDPNRLQKYLGKPIKLP